MNVLQDMCETIVHMASVIQHYFTKRDNFCTTLIKPHFFALIFAGKCFIISMKTALVWLFAGEL